MQREGDKHAGGEKKKKRTRRTGMAPMLNSSHRKSISQVIVVTTLGIDMATEHNDCERVMTAIHKVK